jgi:hypothetical protein
MSINVELLKAFVYTVIRDIFRGQNIVSIFLPAIEYIGSSADSPMMHFTIIGKMGGQEKAAEREIQNAEQFFKLKTLQANDREIVDFEKGGDQLELDPVKFITTVPGAV